MKHSNDEGNERVTIRAIDSLEERFPVGEVDEEVEQDEKAGMILETRRNMRGVWDLLIKTYHMDHQEPDHAITDVFEPGVATEELAIQIQPSEPTVPA